MNSNENFSPPVIRFYLGKLLLPRGNGIRPRGFVLLIDLGACLSNRLERGKLILILLMSLGLLE